MTDDQPIPPAPQGKENANKNATNPNSNAVPEMKVPPSHARYKITCEKKRDKWDVAKLVAEFIGLAFLILYTLYTAGVYHANKEAAEAAKSAAEVARDAFVVGQRPWVKIKHRVIQPLTFNVMRNAGPVAIMTVEDTLENVGQSVALDVKIWEDIIPMDPNFGGTKTARARREQWCEANRHQMGTLSGYMLFPHDPMPQEEDIGPMMSVVNKAADAETGGLHGKVAFVLVGCVVYRSSFEDKNAPAHETQFMYMLGEPVGGPIKPYVRPVGVARKLRLVFFPDGFSAD
jgi:hypothetical protein